MKSCRVRPSFGMRVDEAAVAAAASAAGAAPGPPDTVAIKRPMKEAEAAVPTRGTARRRCEVSMAKLRFSLPGTVLT